MMENSQFEFLSGGEAASASGSGSDSSHRSANGTLEKLQIPLYHRMGREGDVVIMVMGISGSGKSSFIARCCDQDVNIQHGLVSCTKDVQIYSFERRGHMVYLVDTPGFGDSTISDAKVLESIAYFLSTSYESGISLNAIIYLHPISHNRVQGSTRQSFGVFKRLCGMDNMESVVLATTMWDRVPVAEGLSRERELCNENDFFGDMIRNGCAVTQFNNSHTSALNICDPLIDRGTKIVLALQFEMVHEDRSVGETAAGRVIQNSLSAAKDTYLDYVQEIETSQRSTQSKPIVRDEREKQELAREEEEHRAKIEVLDRTMKRLQVHLEELRNRYEELQNSSKRSILPATGQLEEMERLADSAMMEEKPDDRFEILAKISQLNFIRGNANHPVLSPPDHFRPKIKVRMADRINWDKEYAQLDTGSLLNWVQESYVVEVLGLASSIMPVSSDMVAAGPTNQEVRPVGVIELEWKMMAYGKGNFYVLKKIPHCILIGRETINEYKLLMSSIAVLFQHPRSKEQKLQDEKLREEQQARMRRREKEEAEEQARRKEDKNRNQEQKQHGSSNTRSGNPS